MVNKVSDGNTFSAHNAYQQEINDSVKWLRLAVAEIKSLSIPASPENYSIWYEYFSERKPDLKQAMDFRLSKKLPFTPEIYRELYAQYFVDGPEQQLGEIRIAIRKLIDRLMSELSELDKGVDDYSNVLSESVTELANDPDVSSLHVIVQKLISETRQCRESNHSAMAKMATLNKEVDSLRQSLQVMSEEVFEDALTGIANRRGFNKEIAVVIDTCLTENIPAALLLLDIDHFKKVNDEHGHLVGDRVLRFVAETIKRSVKGSDYVARYGGEEFAVILPATDLKGAITVAQQVLKSVSKTKLSVKKGGECIGHVTLSGGLSAIHRKDSVETLIERTDKALYQAKSSGRNSVFTDQSDN